MDQTLLLLLLLKVVAIVTAGKYVHVPLYLNWTNAQRHCRINYTDLAPISSEYDSWLIMSVRGVGWIGLVRNITDPTEWMWSGGAEVSTSFWKPGRPVSDNEIYKAGVFYNNAWYDISSSVRLNSFCYKVHAIRERLTWDEALHYCREHHSDLASVASETEMMLMEKELSKDFSSDRVWIGLHFLDGEWQWLDGQPFIYESWGTSGKSSCPDYSFSCGALRVTGKKETWDALVKVERVVGWDLYDCNVKLHFLCY